MQLEKRSMLITLEKEEVVLAAETSPPYELLLSDNDNVMPRKYTSFWLVFECNNEADAKNFMCVDKLKFALATTLVSYYELAGRLKFLDFNELAVTCDNSGVLWQTATGDFSVKDLRDVNFEQSQLPNGFVYSSPTSDGELLIVRVTTLTDHSVIIGVAAHHSLADVTGIFNFIRSWTEIARGLETSKPDRNRKRLMGDPTSKPVSHHPELLSPDSSVPLPTLPPLTSVTFLFTRAALDSLKAEATVQASGLDNPPRFLSTNDVLCALILRCTHRAENKSRTDIILRSPVNGRSRFEPKLSEMYFGSVAFMAVVRVPAEKLLAENGLGYGATAVRNSIDNVTNERMTDTLNWIATNKKNAKVGFNPFEPVGNFPITNWASVPAYEMNFGWGTPIRFGIPTRDYRGAVFLPAPSGKGSVAVALVTIVEEMNRLQCDQEFMRFVLVE